VIENRNLSSSVVLSVITVDFRGNGVYAERGGVVAPPGEEIVNMSLMESEEDRVE